MRVRVRTRLSVFIAVFVTKGLNASMNKPIIRTEIVRSIYGISYASDSILSNKSLKFQQCFENYKIGNLVWAKIWQYPYWPSIVCNESPLLWNSHIKETKNDIWIHVRFCNDNGSRSWIKANLLVTYSGKSSYRFCPASSKEVQMDSWNGAVDEANNLLLIENVHERFKTFYNLYHNDVPEKRPSTSGTSTSKPHSTNVQHQPSTSYQNLELGIENTFNNGYSSQTGLNQDIYFDITNMVKSSRRVPDNRKHEINKLENNFK